MSKRNRKRKEDRITDFINDALVQVYTKDGLSAELMVAVNANESVGVLSVVKRQEMNDLYLAALFSVLRDALQERVTRDIGRAGEYHMKVSANDASQLELTDGEGRSIRGVDANLDDTPPF